MAKNSKARLKRALEVYGSDATLVEAVLKCPLRHLDEDLEEGETVHVPQDVKDAFEAQGIV